MMHRRTLLALPPALLVASCASPPANLYTLAAVPGPVLRTRPRSVELRRIGLAGYLDRPDIVRAPAPYRLELVSGDRWGEPLGSMLARVIVENLVERLPDAAVFTESGAISTEPDTVVEIDVQRFDADSTGAAVLLAQLVVRRENGGARARVRTIRLTAPTGPTTGELVATLSHLLGQFCDQVAQAVAG